jgi:hypothetical protein
MSFLDELEVDSKPVLGPYFGLIYGPPGVGKTGMCLFAPNPYYLATEDGTDWIDAPRLKKNGKVYLPKDWGELLDMLTFIRSNANKPNSRINMPVKTLVLDSTRFIEQHIYEHILNTKYQKEFKGDADKERLIYNAIDELGYDGRGFAMPYWNRLIAAAKAFKLKGINVIFISNSRPVNVTGKDQKTHKEIDMALQSYGNHCVPGLLAAAADWVYYMDTECETATIGKGSWAKP